MANYLIPEQNHKQRIIDLIKKEKAGDATEPRKIPDHVLNGSSLVRGILEIIGEDPNRDGLQETPNRVVRSWKELFSGYNTNPSDVFKVFDGDGHNEMVLLKDIELYSMCEHHMLPFVGRAHIAYIPADNKIIGISKLARLLEIFSRRLQVQERLGNQVVDTLMQHLQPHGAACIIEAEHFCMRMRGVGKQNSVMCSSHLRGVFKTDPAARAELMGMVR